jgi:hypothetical protein
MIKIGNGGEPHWRAVSAAWRFAPARPKRLVRRSGHTEAWWTALPGLTINRRSRAKRPRSAQVAQLVEHATENRSVGGSIPPLGTISEISSEFSKSDQWPMNPVGWRWRATIGSRISDAHAVALQS